MSEQVLQGSVAVVTGAGSGIGAACVLALASAGARVAALVHDEAERQTAIEAAKAVGVEAAAFVIDVAQERSVEAAFDA